MEDKHKVLTFGVFAVLIIGGMFAISFMTGNSDNEVTGQAWWNMRRPVRMPQAAPARISGHLYLGPFVDMDIEGNNGRFDAMGSIDEVNWNPDDLNANRADDMRVRAGVTEDLYFTERAARNNDMDAISVKTIQISAMGASDDGFKTLFGGYVTDTLHLAVEADGSLGVYREEQDGSKTIRFKTIRRGQSVDVAVIQPQHGNLGLGNVRIDWG